MALDWGEKRVGVALSAGDGMIASPLVTLPNDPKLLDRISQLVNEHEVKEVVVGVPLRLDGSRGPAALAAEQLAEQLRSRSLTVHMSDERMSSRQAERLMIDDNVRRKKRRQSIDQVAATLILQTFLDRRSAKKGGSEYDG